MNTNPLRIALSDRGNSVGGILEEASDPGGVVERYAR